MKKFERSCTSRPRPGPLFYSLLLCSVVFSGLLLAGESALTDAVTTTIAPVPGTFYHDQLIDPDVTDRLISDEGREIGAEPQGRRFLSLEYRHYQERQKPEDINENGLLLNWRRETRDYGDFDLEASVRRGKDQLFAESSGSGQFVLNQYDFALDREHVMDNTLGVLRSSADPMITSSFRLNLPSTLLAGGQTRVTRDGTSAFYASAGRIGQLDIGQIQGFDITDGDQYALGYSRQLSGKWRAGAHLVSVNGSNNTPNHQSFASALQYEDKQLRKRYVAHTLVDSKGQYGLWADGDRRIRDWRYRYGLFRLEPGLLWSESTPANDQQGGYVRAEIQKLRYDITVGLDLTQTDIDKQSAVAGNNLYNGFFNATWRMTRKTNAGSTLTLRGNSPRDGPDRDNSHAYVLSTYLSHAFPVGATRIQVQVSDIEESGTSGNGYGIFLDQDWYMSRDFVMSASLSHETENGLIENEDRSSASLLLRHNFSTDLNWNGDISYVRIDRDTGRQQDNMNATLALVWDFLPQWNTSIRATYNKVDGGISGPGNDLENEKTLLFGIRYAASTGRPFVRAGQDTDAKGYGSVNGLVFYDENGDGKRQAGERVAAGVFVYLDRRYQAVTGRDGRYEFESVPAGAHAVTIALEDLPLPWGLRDETFLKIRVDVRRTSRADFALQRINE